MEILQQSDDGCAIELMDLTEMEEF